MEGQTTFRRALAWTGIILFVAAGVLLLEWPLTRPWLIGTLMVLTIPPIAKILHEVARRRLRFDWRCAERLALPTGVMCLLAHMMWDRPFLQLIGVLLSLGSAARAWHEERRVSHSSGTITR